jgi:hypothetical protein
VEIGLNPLQTSGGTFVLAAIVDIASGSGPKRVPLAVESAPNAMLMVDDRGRIVLANAQRNGCSDSPAGIARPVDRDAGPHPLRAGHPGHRSEFHASPRSRPMGADRELYAIRRTEPRFPSRSA